MSFNEKLPEWNDPGVEPPQSKKDEGFKPGEKPSAQWFNWLLNRIYKSIQEIREKVVVKVAGKDLSTNDYTTDEKIKLGGISKQATKIEGSAINGNIKIDGAQAKVYEHPASHPAGIIEESATKRFVSDTEKNAWNEKETPSGSQEKANAALASAKVYTDEEILELAQLIAAELAGKVDKVNGKGLSTNDFDNTEKQNLKTVFDSFVGRDVAGRPITDANNAILTGFYFLSSSAINGPPVENGALIVVSYGNSYISQIVLDWRTNKSYSRVCNNGVWMAWQELYHSGNISKTAVGLGNVDNIKQLPIAGGTLTGIAVAQNNTSYTVSQMRNITLSPNDASGTAPNGAIWIKYKA